MGVTTKKYRVSVSFCPKLVIFGKTCHTLFQESGNEASIRVPRLFKSHV
jgi:hypothetical protein